MTTALTASLRLSLEDKLSGGLGRLTGLLDKLGRIAKGLSFNDIGRGAANIDRATKASSALSHALHGVKRAGGEAVGAIERLGRAGSRIAHRVGGAAKSYGEKVGAVGAAVGGYSLYEPIEQYAGFENTLRHVAITEGKSGKAVGVEVARLTKMLDAEALRTGQRSEELAAAYSFLITTGMKASVVDKLMPAHAMAATAYNVPSDSMGQAVFALHDSMKIAEQDMPAALAAMARAAKEGHFNVESFSRFLPLIGGRLNMLGMTGRGSADASFAALETVVKNSADPGTAATNFGDLLHYMTSPIAVRSFKKQDIDLPKMYAEAQAKGINPLYAFLGKLDSLIKGKGDVQAALTLGKLLHNQQAGDAALSLAKHKDAFLALTKLLDRVDDTTIKTDYTTARDAPYRQLETSKEGGTQTVRELGRAFTALLVPINFVESTLLEVFSYLDEHVPGATDVVLGLAGGFIAVSAAIGTIMLLMPGMAAAFALVATQMAALWNLNAVVAFRLAMIALAEPIAALLGITVGWVGVLAVAIAGAVYLIYRYWRPITAFFRRLWPGIVATAKREWLAFGQFFEGLLGTWAKAWQRFAEGLAGIHPNVGHPDMPASHADFQSYAAARQVGGEITVRAEPGTQVTDTQSKGPVKLVPKTAGSRGDVLSRARR